MFCYFIVGIKKCYHFLDVNLVSCYPVEFISSSRFCVELLSIYDENLTSPFPIWIYFISFFFSDCCDKKV